MPDDLHFGQQVRYGEYTATVLDMARRAGRPDRVQIRIQAPIEHRIRWVRLADLAGTP